MTDTARGNLAVAEAAGDRWAVASAHGYLAFACWLQRDFDRATAALPQLQRAIASYGGDFLGGHGCAVVRARPDGTWRIAAGAWHLGTEIPL
jgi:hypothetical protein